MLRPSSRPRRRLVLRLTCLAILSLAMLPMSLCLPIVAVDNNRYRFLLDEPSTLLPQQPESPTKIRFPAEYSAPTTTPLVPRRESGHTLQSLPPESSWSSWLQPDRDFEQTSLDHQNKGHKIMAKSIFVAPDYTPTCKNGLVYSERFKQCVANVYVNVKAIHDQLLLSRLNKHYFPNGTRIKPTRTTYRPVKLPKPVMSDPPLNQPVNLANRFVVPPAISEPTRVESSKEQEPVVMVLNEEKANRTKEEVNITSDAPDYNTAASARPEVLDRTTEESTGSSTEKKEISEDPIEDVVTMPTTSATSAASYSEYESSEVDKLTTRQELGRRESTTYTEGSEEETRFETDTTIHTVAPLELETSVDQVGITLTSTQKAYPEDRLVDEDDDYVDEETQSKHTFNDYDRYYDTTEEPDSESVESRDELLEPSEAGMTIPAKVNHHWPTTADFEVAASTTFEESTVVPSASTRDVQTTYSDADSTTKSGPMDYVTSTVMSDISTDATTETDEEESITTPKAENLVKSTTGIHTTQAIPVITTAENKDTIDVDRDLLTESAVTSDPRSIGTTTTTTSFRSKGPTNPDKTMDEDISQLWANNDNDESNRGAERISMPEFLLRRERPGTGEPAGSKNDSNIPSEFKDQMAKLSRFVLPEFRRDPTSGVADESNDEVNSIHSQSTYKEHLLSAYPPSNPSTRSNQLARQKQASGNRRNSQPALRTNRQQSKEGSRNQRKPPTFWDFWKTLPHKKELGLYPVMDLGLKNAPAGAHD